VVVKNTFLEVIPKMEKLKSRPRSCPIMRSRSRTSRKEHFRVEVCVPLDPIDVSCNSSTDILSAEERDQEKKKAPRPCKGKRNRYKKLVHHLERQIMANPGVFTMDDIVLPPSLQANQTQRLKLIDRMAKYQQEVLTSCSPYSGH